MRGAYLHLTIAYAYMKFLKAQGQLYLCTV
jgi:hypothetical protein